MTCPFVKKNGRWQVYATTKGDGVQYYRIYNKLCNLLNNTDTVCDVVSTGTSDSAEASLVTSCGGILPLVKSSDLNPVTVAELPAGTSIVIVAKTVSSIPQGIVIGL